MLVQFTVVKDESAWLIDTTLMSYIHSESQAPDAKILERGKLVFLGMQGVIRLFALEGRTTSTEGPGGGFCTFGYASIDLDTTLTFHIATNVPVKDLNSVRPITMVRYELIPTGEQNESYETSAGPQESEGSRISEESPLPVEPITFETNVQPGN